MRIVRISVTDLDGVLLDETQLGIDGRTNRLAISCLPIGSEMPHADGELTIGTTAGSVPDGTPIDDDDDAADDYSYNFPDDE